MSASSIYFVWFIVFFLFSEIRARGISFEILFLPGTVILTVTVSSFPSKSIFPFDILILDLALVNESRIFLLYSLDSLLLTRCKIFAI